MPYDVRVITPQDFVKIDRYGEVDLEATREMLRAVFIACANSRIRNILIDGRHLHGDVSFREISDLATELGGLGMNSSHRLALLHRPRGLLAPFLAERAEENGWVVRAFDSFEEAFLWLHEI